MKEMNGKKHRKKKNGLKLSRGLLGPVLVLLLGGLSYSLNNISQTLQNTIALNDGIQTCFSRVSQTFTATLLGDSSSLYLAKGFTSLTEECLAETIEAAEVNFAEKMSGLIASLNTLSSNTHWFHENINSTKESFSGQTEQSRIFHLGKKFEDIEDAKDQANDKLEEARLSNEAIHSNLKWAFWFLFVITPFYFLKQYFEQRSNSTNNSLFEIEASEHLVNMSEGSVKDEVVENLVRSSLQENGLQKCANLFNSYIRELKEVRVKGKHAEADLTKTAPERTDWITPAAMEAPKTQNEIQVETISEVIEDTSSYNGLSRVKLDSVLSTVIGHLKNKIFSEGVILNLDIDEDIEILAKRDALEQVFYHLVLNSVQTCTHVLHKKRLNISMKKLGASIAMEFSDTGVGFSPEFMKEQVGIGPNSNQTSIGLTLCKEFMNEFKGQITFENRTNSIQQITGGNVKLLFRMAPVAQKGRKLTSITRGRKRDIARQMVL